MSEPFTAEDVLFRFVPTEEEKAQYRSEYDKQCVEVVVVRGYDPPGLRIWGRRGNGIWIFWGVHVEVIVARLLHDLTALREYIGSPGGPSYEELVKENDRLAAERALLVAEREVYREMLAKLTKEWRTRPEVIEALEQGRKIREGK